MAVTRTIRCALLSGALLFSACGGGDGDVVEDASDAVESTTTAEVTTTTEAPPTTEASTTTDAAVEADVEAPTTTEASVTFGDTDADDPVVVAYCAASVAADSLGDDDIPTDIASFQALVDEQVALIEGTTAPDAIASDLQVITETMQDMSTAVGSVDSIADVMNVLGPFGDGPEFAAASANIDAFERAYCPAVESSIPVPPAVADNPLGITEDEIRAILETEDGRQGLAQQVATTTSMTQEEALCFVESTDPDVVVALYLIATGESTEIATETQTGLLAGLDACGMDISVFG